MHIIVDRSGNRKLVLSGPHQAAVSCVEIVYDRLDPKQVFSRLALLV
jgi:hypothetical protein